MYAYDLWLCLYYIMCMCSRWRSSRKITITQKKQKNIMCILWRYIHYHHQSPSSFMTNHLLLQIKRPLLQKKNPPDTLAWSEVIVSNPDLLTTILNLFTSTHNLMKCNLFLVSLHSKVGVFLDPEDRMAIN